MQACSLIKIRIFPHSSSWAGLLSISKHAWKRIGHMWWPLWTATGLVEALLSSHSRYPWLLPFGMLIDCSQIYLHLPEERHGSLESSRAAKQSSCQKATVKWREELEGYDDWIVIVMRLISKSATPAEARRQQWPSNWRICPLETKYYHFFTTLYIFPRISHL